MREPDILHRHLAEGLAIAEVAFDNIAARIERYRGDLESEELTRLAADCREAARLVRNTLAKFDLDRRDRTRCMAQRRPPRTGGEMSDYRERACTCHPDEAPKPCPQRYAYSECVLAAEIERLRAELALYKQNYARKQLTDSERRALEEKG